MIKDAHMLDNYKVCNKCPYGVLASPMFPRVFNNGRTEVRQGTALCLAASMVDGMNTFLMGSAPKYESSPHYYGEYKSKGHD